MIRRRYHSFSPEALNPKDMGAERNGRMQQCQSTKQFMARLYLPWRQPYQPQGLQDCCPRRLYEKDIPDESWEEDMFVFEWMVPSMRAELQSTTGLQKRGEESSGQETHLLLTG